MGLGRVSAETIGIMETVFLSVLAFALVYREKCLVWEYLSKKCARIDRLWLNSWSTNGSRSEVSDKHFPKRGPFTGAYLVLNILTISDRNARFHHFFGNLSDFKCFP